jgi:hypothetical protein
VEDPRADGHEHADGEPLRPEQADGTGHRVLQADVRSRARAAMLKQEPDVRRESAEKSKKNSD